MDTLFASYEQQQDHYEMLTRNIAVDLTHQLYRVLDEIKYWNSCENIHMEVLDGIAQNVAIASIPGYSAAIDARAEFNTKWELQGPNFNNFMTLFDVVEDVLLSYLKF